MDIGRGDFFPGSTDSAASPFRRAPKPAPTAQLRGLPPGGSQHLKIGEVEQAIVQYRRALAVAPSFEAQLGLADGERLAGRDDLAAKEYERALRLDPRGAAALLPLARIYGRHARTRPQAEGRYRAYLEVRPGDAEAQLELGRLLAWQGKAADAVELLARRVTRRAITRGLGGLVDAIPSVPVAPTLPARRITSNSASRAERWPSPSMTRRCFSSPCAAG